MLAAACADSGGGTPGSPGTLAAMAVTPEDGFASSGPFGGGGPFEPAGQDYTVSNLSASPLDFLVRTTEPWIQLSSPVGIEGRLAAAGSPGSSVTVQMTIDQDSAASLAPGAHPGFVDFLNVTVGSEGSGDTSFRIDLEVTGQANLEVTPNGPFATSGPLGVGPFDPPSMDYELRNTGVLPLDWTAQTSTAELTVSPASGRLAAAGGPGDRVTVTVSVDQNAARALPLGTYATAVSFRDLTNPSRRIEIERRGTLSVVPLGGVSASSVSQFGITWTFHGDHPVGRFANGDWWVVGPVTIVDIDPPSTTVGHGRVVNGSMVNPSPFDGVTQGYDAAMYGPYRAPSHFDPAMNVAMGVSPANPLVLATHSSLVSTISLPTAGARPQLQTAAVLTVLDAVPPAGSFRPPYAGHDKTVRYNEDQLQTALLARLAPVHSTPSLARVEHMFERPWIDHVPDWLGRYTHPRDNMPDYGREICDQVGFASLMLHLDFSEAEKETLLVRFVQLGIDFYGIVEDGGRNNWPAGGGHHSGRKWPILFAGLMLGDPAMSGIGSRAAVAFNEDDQTFYVQETSPGVYNHGEGGYGRQHVGMPEWGNQHWKQINRGQPPTFDDVDWLADPYRVCCTANVWWGELLATHIMGARSLWQHDALFDYQDRYLSVNASRGIEDWRLSWSVFPIDMWRKYRAHY